jgi:hypothetical protein
VTPKVFGIGFQKTGTTTLEVILSRLGYRTAGYHQFRHLAERDGLTLQELETFALKLASEYDAAKDTPWPLFYKSLDKAYPGSKFIHVTRNPQTWINSAVKDFGHYPNAIYGVPYPEGYEDIWLERYNRHNAEVRDYFSGHPEDCLFLNLEDGVSFEVVCGFLDRPLVATGVPKANTRMKKRLKMLWWRLSRLKSR